MIQIQKLRTPEKIVVIILKGVGSRSTIIGLVNKNLAPAVNHFSAYFKFLLSELVYIFWIMIAKYR